MTKTRIAEPFEISEISLRNCFSAPSLGLFTAVVIGWALTVGRHTISRVILTMGLHKSRHFAIIYRCISLGRWLADMVSHALFELMLENLVPRNAEVFVWWMTRSTSTMARRFLVRDGNMMDQLLGKRTAKAMVSVSSSPVLRYGSMLLPAVCFVCPTQPGSGGLPKPR